MIENLNKFFIIESNWTNIGEELWKEENFLLELPLKWELSFAAENRDSVIGYIIGSEHEPKLSIVNKILVDHSYRGYGIGKRLISRYFAACLEKGIETSELKALNGNGIANSFYKKLGYQRIGETKGTDGKIRNFYRKILI